MCILSNDGLISDGKMTFWRGQFQLGNSVEAEDTFLSLAGWHKGVVWVNGFNLGRYWPVVGPQVTLYVPGTILRSYPDTNDIILLEQVNSREKKINRSNGYEVVKLGSQPLSSLFQNSKKDQYAYVIIQVHHPPTHNFSKLIKLSNIK